MHISFTRLSLAVAFTMISGASIASATTIPISNPSFETPVQSCVGCYTLFTAIPGSPWVTALGLASVWRPTVGAGQEFAALPDGNQITPIGFSGAGSEIYQDLSATLLANTTYTLSFYVGQRTDYAFGGYNVSLEAKNGGGLTVLASDSGGAPAPGLFVQRNIVFKSGSSPQIGQPLRIDISTPAGNNQASFDLFALTTSNSSSTPEPGSLALGASGLLLLAGALRRIRQD